MHHKRGFTLIEVLIALVILAIAMTAVIKATQESIHDTMHVKNKLAAHWVAMNILSEIQMQVLATPAAGNLLQGDVRLLQRQWHWQAAVVQGGNAYYERVSVDVSNKQTKQHWVRLEGFVRLPEVRHAPNK